MTASRVAAPAFFTAEGIALFADSAFLVVMPWLVLSIAGRPSTVSLMLAVVLLPSIVSGLVGGYVIDRIGRRFSSILASLGSAITVAVLAAFDATCE